MLKMLAQAQVENVDEEVVQEEVPSESNTEGEKNTDGKSPAKRVSWGPKHIKPFKKNSLICSNSEAQTTPSISSSAPKVLKKTDPSKNKFHKSFTQGARKSERLQM